MLSKVFDVAKRSLGAYQYAMNVTSNNISNAQTEGYTRQKVVFKTVASEYRGKLEWGSGVDVQNVTRQKNALVDDQLLIYNNAYADANKRSELLGQMESLLSEPSDEGLSKLMNGFFNSWSDLAANPSLSSYRQNLIQSADKLSNKFSTITRGYNQLKVDIKSDINEKVADLNSKLEDIKNINQKIFQATLKGIDANDLKDQRDKVVSDLSKYVNVKSSYDEKGNLSLTIGGIFAVDEGSTTKFKVVESTDGKINITATDDENAKVTLKGGELSALVDTYSNIIPSYQEKVDTIAQTIVDQVNALHVQGYTQHDPPLGGKSSVNDTDAIKFFEGYKDGKLVINDKILSDERYIAASKDSSSDNGENALAIANIAQKTIISGDTISDNYSKFIVQVGNDKKLVDQKATSNDTIITQLELQRDSYAGVSIDEEMTNMIEYQRAYQASSKLIKTADEMIQTLLQMV